jgi:DNA-binding CsgD family transcriptional regulator
MQVSWTARASVVVASRHRRAGVRKRAISSPGLGEAIDRQLDRWGLSPAEKDVALLLLKGLSHKEIGQIRGVSEATVRQQARALYQIGGLEGRHDLVAFFLEDLLGPREPRPPA